MSDVHEKAKRILEVADRAAQKIDRALGLDDLLRPADAPSKALATVEQLAAAIDYVDDDEPNAAAQGAPRIAIGHVEQLNVQINVPPPGASPVAEPKAEPPIDLGDRDVGDDVIDLDAPTTLMQHMGAVEQPAAPRSRYLAGAEALARSAPPMTRESLTVFGLGLGVGVGALAIAEGVHAARYERAVEAASRPSVENAIRYIAAAPTEIERQQRGEEMHARLGVDRMSDDEYAALKAAADVAEQKMAVEARERAVLAQADKLADRAWDLGGQERALSIAASMNANTAASGAHAATMLGAAEISAQAADRVVGAMDDFGDRAAALGDRMAAAGDRAAVNADRIRSGLDGQRDHFDSRLDSIEGRIGDGGGHYEPAAPVDDPYADSLMAKADELLRK